MRNRFTCSAVVFALTATSAAAVPRDNPRELGRVAWQRDFEKSLAESGASGKPIFLLFQEVPGCQGCRDFGDQPLSHPLMVEAIEDLFIPVAVFNNKDGEDAKLLARFDEPAWNYPVVRFLDANAKDIIPRREGIYSIHGMAARMVDALQAARRPVPEYLKLVLAESHALEHGSAKAIFAMPCFWDGEGKLGAIEGVVASRAGWLEKREVVEVAFDPAVITYAELVRAANLVQCAAAVYAVDQEQLSIASGIVDQRARPATAPITNPKAADSKFELTKTAMRHLPLTPMQAARINAALRLRQDHEKYLSPRQKTLLAQLDAALAKNSAALDGLNRPDDVSLLASYEDRLLARLN